MKRALILLALIAVSAHAAVQTPSQFLGFEVGADKNLADYKQIVSYFRALAAASPRVQVQDLGSRLQPLDHHVLTLWRDGAARPL